LCHSSFPFLSQLMDIISRLFLSCKNIIIYTASVITRFIELIQSLACPRIVVHKAQNGAIWKVLPTIPTMYENSASIPAFGIASLRFASQIVYKCCERQIKTNPVALSPQANYTDWVTATFRRNLVPTFVDRGLSRGQRSGSPTVVNISFLDWGRYISFK
jgi:hypothetical protein